MKKGWKEEKGQAKTKYGRKGWMDGVKKKDSKRKRGSIEGWHKVEKEREDVVIKGTIKVVVRKRKDGGMKKEGLKKGGGKGMNGWME